MIKEAMFEDVVNYDTDLHEFYLRHKMVNVCHLSNKEKVESTEVSRSRQV